MVTDVKNLKGSVVQGWLLGDVLGAGADGIVYRGSKGEQTAGVKIFFPDSIEKNGVGEELQRLELQLQLKGGKRHPNLVEVYDGGSDQDINTLYLIMELVPGNSLDKVVEKIPPEAIPSLLSQLVSAAKFLEEQELVHRDIKPANIMISEDYKHLTLLDLGIILKHLKDDDERLSGDEFVATTRYSPPEFVWRSEVANDDGAWRSITFYQIGATLHDVIMQKPLFNGFDKPRAKLYDSVRIRSPIFDNAQCETWLVNLCKCCLVKDWRERLNLVSWDSFSDPSNGLNDIEYKKQLIRLRQIRADEHRQLVEAEKLLTPSGGRVHDLWDLYNKVFMEIRQFLMSSTIFPKFSSANKPVSDTEYQIRFDFEKDEETMFAESLTFEIVLSVDVKYELATDMKIFSQTKSGKELSKGNWTEMFTVDSATKIIQDSLLQVADLVVPNI
jgi:serine/threonine protein kinase